MYETVLVRRAVAEDAPSIASVLSRSFAEFEPLYTPEGFAATVSDAEQISARFDEGPVWVALREGRVVGTVSAVPKVEGLYVRSMAALPEERGRGTGRRLLEYVEEYATRAGHLRIYLSTTPFLAGAIRLYERFGFRRTDAAPHDLFGTPLFTMEKAVVSSQ